MGSAAPSAGGLTDVCALVVIVWASTLRHHKDCLSRRAVSAPLLLHIATSYTGYVPHIATGAPWPLACLVGVPACQVTVIIAVVSHASVDTISE